MRHDPELIARRIREAAGAPEIWAQALGDVSASVNGAGALLFCVDDRLVRPPASAEQAHVLDEYLTKGWNALDVRYRGIPKMERRGFITDEDCMDRDEIASSQFYQDFLAGHGIGAFAGVGFRAGGDLWCLSVQRRLRDGPFEPRELDALLRLWGPLSDAATLSRQFDFARLKGMTDALELTRDAAIVCDRGGRIASINARAEALVGRMIDPRSRTLSLRSAADRDALRACLASSQRRRGPEPAACVVRDPKGGEILVRAIEVDGMSVFAPADGRAVLLLLKRRVLDPVAALAARSSLTAAESAIVASLRAGGSVAEIAQARGVRPDTIRTQLKSIYLKTGASGQARLLSRVAALGDERPAD
ncbi:helix-turn-helix transcriptional regulator [Chenggangzhangella methanolivorans]|uniref:helix-turn-helix transcriptional regulator n=1 Tax=Chenggangzhangella methanolivorans TaxID=1437009 RepID=UPI00360CAE64